MREKKLSHFLLPCTGEVALHGATSDKVSEPTTSPSWCWLYQTKS